MIPLYICDLEEALGMDKLRFLFFIQYLKLNNTLFVRCYDCEGKDYLIPEKELNNICSKKDALRFHINHSLLNYLC